jgi:hypothetical protein
MTCLCRPLSSCTVILAASLLATLPCEAQTAVADRPAVKLVDPRKDFAQNFTNPAGFAWSMFIYMNWPEFPGKRGAPNFDRSIGSPGATVWESYKNVSEIYQTNGLRPVAWEIDDELPPIPPSQAREIKAQIAAVRPVDSRWVHFLAEPAMIDQQQICDVHGVPIEYDVRDNQSYYDYVVNNPSGYELYNIQGQQAALNDTNFQFSFPEETLEIKASWRILQLGDDESRYWTAIGVYWDNYHHLRAARIGLTGLHIISRAVPDWVWMTFEQVDNPTHTFKYNLGEKGAPVGDNPNYDKDLDRINQQYDAALAGTKWQYYKLMKVQTDFLNTAKQPILMSNTQMETYFQPSSSCISCHKLASIGLPKNPAQELRLNTFGNGGLGYVGAIQFQQIAQQQSPGEPFKDMGFVWSLRQAHFKKQPAAHPGHIKTAAHPSHAAQ